VDDEDVLREVSRTLLEIQYDCEIKEASSGNKAVKILSDDAPFDLILCDYKMPDGSGDTVYNFTKKLQKPPAFILVSAWSHTESSGMENLLSDSEQNAYVSKPYSAEQLYEQIDTVMASLNGMKVESGPDFCRINAHKFLQSEFDAVCVYLKLSERKYVKIADNTEAEKKEIIQKYIDKNIKHVYLKKNDYDLYLKNLFDKVKEKIDSEKLDTGEIKTEEIFPLQITTIEAIHDVVYNIGIDEKIVKLTDQYISSTMNAVKSQKKLYALLETIFLDGNYIYVHAQLTSYIICALCRESYWVDKTHERDLVYAALFQNAFLDDNKLAMVYDNSSADWQELNGQQKTLVRTHMVKIVSMLEPLRSFSLDAQNAILNHHERPDAKGFPRGLTDKQISPYDGLFIMAGHFAHELIVQGTSPERIIKLKDYFKTYYNVGNYQNAVEAFNKVFK